MFNSGVIYEVVGDKPTSMSLHSTMDAPKFNKMETTGAQWLSKYKTNNTVHVDLYRILLLNGFLLNGINQYTTTQPLHPEIKINHHLMYIWELSIS